jgi:hypothetical protein
VTAAAAVSLSNRRETAPKTGVPPLGVDRLSLSFGLVDFERDATAWTTVTARNPGTPHERMTYGTSVDGVFVGVQEHPGHPGVWIGKVEANPSRVLDPDGWHALPVRRLRAAVEAMGKRVGQLVQLSDPISESRVKRIDVARDFQTDDPAGIVRGLGPVHRPWSRRNLVHFDPARGGAQTLMVGSASGVVRLYDKAAETNGAAPPGTLRWELEARSDWAKKYGLIERLGDITQDNVRSLAEDRWRWSAMDRELSGQEQIVSKVMRLDVSPTVKERLIGRLVMEQMGSSYPMGNSTASKYRRLVREMGIALDPDAAGGAITHLDWETGKQLTKVGF